MSRPHPHSLRDGLAGELKHNLSTMKWKAHKYSLLDKQNMPYTCPVFPLTQNSILPYKALPPLNLTAPFSHSAACYMNVVTVTYYMVIVELLILAVCMLKSNNALRLL